MYIVITTNLGHCSVIFDEKIHLFFKIVEISRIKMHNHNVAE